MTVAPLPTTPLPAWLTTARAAMNTPCDPTTASPTEARAIVAEMARFEAQWAARKLAYIRAIDATAMATSTGATSTGSLIAGDFGGDSAGAARQVRVARNLARANATDRALAAGELSPDKAAVIARAVADLPASLDEHTKLRAEKRLISDAGILSLPDLRRRVLRLADLYTDRQSADNDENTKLRHQEAMAWQNTELWMSAPRNGLVRFGGALPTLQAALLKNHVGAIIAPRRHHHEPPNGDDLTAAQRMGRGFAHWIERIPTDGLPTTGGTPATLTINLSYDQLLAQSAPATLATGDRISAAEARRLACNAGILPRVLDGKSQILDQGRTKRIYTPAQRLALADRDLGCTYPGCDRPPSWTEAHHLDHWTRDNGPTNLDNAALLCARHHHWIHNQNLEGRVKDNRVEFHICGIWQTNHRWRPMRS